MCGIVGFNGKSNCIDVIIKGLESLEYRGYDSAGIAYTLDNKITIKKSEGRISNLKEKLVEGETSNLGIGHTRWATHGCANETNAHPHRVGKVTVVHNGIIENYAELKETELSEYTFKSETDTEVVAALIDKLLKENTILNVLSHLDKYLIGNYALGILIEGDNNLYAIRKNSPLIIGVSNEGNFIASDVPAILTYTNKYYLLDNDEYAVLTKDDVKIYYKGELQKKKLKTFDFDATVAMKNGYDHYMLKEIYEQPELVNKLTSIYLSSEKEFINKFKGLERYDSIDIVACGSAYHAGMVGSYLISEYSDIDIKVDIASEYRYTKHHYSRKHLIMVISQSGETADTLAVIRDAKAKGIDTMAIVNVEGSSIAREADKVYYTYAGPEIAVATTKGYTTQVIVLSYMAMYLGIKNHKCKFNRSKYDEISSVLKNILEDVSDIKDIAKKIHKENKIFYIGRKIDYALCLEASLKLKEVSYINAVAYAAGELKHGTISLIDEETPVISIITDDDIRLKTLSNTKEVCARGAHSILITNDDVTDKKIINDIIVVEKVDKLLQSLPIIIKCQLLGYYVALNNGCDIDKPRNLAKSVTVE